MLKSEMAGLIAQLMHKSFPVVLFINYDRIN